MAREKVQDKVWIGRGLNFALVFLHGLSEVSRAELWNGGASKVDGEILAFLGEEADKPIFRRKLIGALDRAVRQAPIRLSGLSVDHVPQRRTMTVIHVASPEEPPPVLDNRPANVGAGIHGVEDQIGSRVALRAKQRRQVIAFDILILVVGLRSAMVCIAAGLHDSIQ